MRCSDKLRLLSHHAWIHGHGGDGYMSSQPLRQEVNETRSMIILLVLFSQGNPVYLEIPTAIVATGTYNILDGASSLDIAPRRRWDFER